MSDQAARLAFSRMNMQAVAVAAHYSGLAQDLKHMAETDPEVGQARFLARRAELCAAYGLSTDTDQRKPYAFARGLAIIPVNGLLINRFGQSWGWVTGYNFIRAQLNLALADDDVEGIILDVNSYGGEAAGCFELSEEIRAAREKKPILAMVDSNCYSAGYAIGSAASKLVCIPSGGVGSIGVVMMHTDYSEMMKDWGIKVTFIYESDHKVDGNPYEALPDTVKANFQASIHKAYERFVSLVAANRGMDAQAVRDTKSRVYEAEDAVALGLIDAVSSPIAAATAFLSELSGSTPQLSQGAIMPQENTGPDATTTAQQQAEQQAAVQKAAAEARTAERARVSAITGSEEAKGREQLANHIAMNTEMSVEDAKAMLAASPKAEATKPAAAANPFEQAMNKDKHPNVGADSAAGEGEPGQKASAEEQAKGILANYALATGRKTEQTA